MIHINRKERALVNSENGDIIHPTCWDDLLSYHSYLLGRDKPNAAQILLQRVFDGERVISKMIEQSQKHRDGQ
jgi:hypothetical protein